MQKEPLSALWAPAGVRVGLHTFYQARDEGIEPPPTVLETVVLPLYESRNHAPLGA